MKLNWIINGFRVNTFIAQKAIFHIIGETFEIYAINPSLLVHLSLMESFLQLVNYF